MGTFNKYVTARGPFSKIVTKNPRGCGVSDARLKMLRSVTMGGGALSVKI